MGFSPVTLWCAGKRSCILRRIDGQYELLLQHQSHVIRLETCENEHKARAKAQQWLIDFEVATPPTA